MVNKAYFFRDVIDFQELEIKTRNAIDNNNTMQSFQILEKIVLSVEEFDDFIRCFKKTRYFIKKISSRLTMNKNAEYTCVLVMCENYSYGILVNSSGYSYARIVAIINL